jgi:S-DNA-T family DNA segregation ATPase FtsK/SpoIIIE
VRLTVVSPAATADVEVDEGVPVARLCGSLARLTGDPAWRSGLITADGVPLTDDHPTGLAPLRHGATLRPGPGPVPDAVRAARAPWHLAVVGGPDTGALLVADGPTTLGPGGRHPVHDDEPWLVLLRPRAARNGRTRRRVLVARRPVLASTARRRPRWRRTVPAVFVRGTTSPAFLVSARGRSRRIRRWRWTPWRVGDSLHAGSSTLVVRRPDAALARSRGRAALAGWMRYLPAVAGATTSAALALTMHQPVLLLGALSALVLVGPRASTAPQLEPVPAPDASLDVAALRVDMAAASDGAAGRRPSTDGPRAGPSPTGPPPPGQSWIGPVPTDGPSFARGWDGDLAVVGRRPEALAAARGLALGVLAAEPATVVELRTDRPGDWSWLVWFGGVLVGPATETASAGAAEPARTGPRLVVLDGRHGHEAVAGSPRVLRVVDGRPPPWCTAAIEVDGRTARPGGGGTVRTLPYVGVSAAVADATARALAGRSDRSGDHPEDVLLGDLPGVPPPDPDAIARRWAHPTLAIPLGRAADGSPVVADLVRDGPHALVAGTTGSGKSELLATITLGLALAQPPDRLAVLLVDFKGATGLPPALAELPHVIGHVSDLDAAGARRTLRGLAAELRRRERVLAARGARDLAELDPLDPGTPPRLLVVVDEFRALADELPELLPSWARLAAQGRSLGVHLLLATQRPAGAVPADLRANVGLRVVLRVVDAADSSDLVGVPDAAGFDRPGMALLSRGPGRPELLHVARAVSHRPRPPVRLATPWPADPGGGWAPPPPPGDARREPRRDPATSDLQDEGGPAGRARTRPGGPAPRAGDGRATRSDDGPAAWVAAIRAAAVDRTAATGAWLPPLPPRIAWSDVPPGSGLPLALADLPDDLARGPVRWDADAGHLLVLGGPGSGRSTALSTVAAAALAEGRPVHAVGLPAALVPRGVSSRLDADDGPRVARLIRLLAGSRPSGDRRALLVVDDVATVVATLAPLARGAALECLEQLWAAAGGPVAVAAAGGIGAATQRLAPFFADRLVLGSPDPTGDLLAGVPLELAGPRTVPGRAVHLGRGGAALCQVALPPPESRHGPRAGTGPPLARGSTAHGGRDQAAPRVRPLPTRVAGPLPPPEAPPTGRGPLVTLGLGGDDAGPVAVDLARPLLVVGPRGSGRTAALEVLAAGAAAAGLRTVHPAGPADLDAEGVLLVVDDLDELTVQDPALADALTARLATREPVRLVAATTTAHAVGAFRGPVPALCRSGRVLVLDVTEPGAADLLGPEGPWLADARRQPPGRGALRLGRDVVPLQVVAPD